MVAKVKIKTKSAAQPDDDPVDPLSVETPESQSLESPPVEIPDEESSDPPLDDDSDDDDDDLEEDPDQPDPDDESDDDDDDEEDDENEEEVTIAWLQTNVVERLDRIEQGLTEKPTRKKGKQPKPKLSAKERRRQNRKRSLKLPRSE